MNTKRIYSALLLGGLTFCTALATPQNMAYAQEQEPQQISKSTLASVNLPTGALLVPTEMVPQQVMDVLGLLVKAAGPKVKRGRTEILAWAGADYKLSRVPQMKAQLSAKLKAAGWDYTEGDPVPGAEAFTMVSIVKTTPQRVGVIGFWIPTEKALMLAWTETRPANGATGAATTDETTTDETTETNEAATNEEVEAATETEVTAEGEGTKKGFETPAPGQKSANPPLEFQVGTNRAVINVMKGIAPPRVTFAALQPKAGTVRGYVKDSKGKPLQGAVIGVRSSATGGFYSGAQGKTDAKGYYEIAVPWGAAEFYCAGYTRDHGDGRAAMGLFPADGEASQFATANGLVENWVMLPYGIANKDRASEDPNYSNNYYGGSLTIGYFVADPRFDGSDGLPEGSEIDLTLVPVGPLMDGSAGRSFVFHQKVVDTLVPGFKIVNVPVGQYRMIAWVLKNGKPKPLHIKESGPKAGLPFGLEPKQAELNSVITFRPNGATASNVAPGNANWDTLDVTLWP